MIKVLLFCGTDGSGKSSLIKEVNKYSDYEYLCIDRFTDSAYVYDFIYNRANRETELLNFERSLKKLNNARFYLIYCHCSNKETLLSRLGYKKESKNIINNLDIANTKYEEYFKKSKIQFKIKVDTSDMIEISLLNIIKFIEDNE